MQTVLLIAALSVDVFLASMACGTERIYIGKRTALCISVICSGVLFFALEAGCLLDGIIKESYTKIFCFVLLLAVGIFKLTEYGIKRYIKKHRFLCKRVKLTFSQLNFILSIYNNPIMADQDHSSTMSVAEGAVFALAMSLDGFVGGLGAGFLGLDIRWTVLGNLMLSFLAVSIGSYIGRKAVQRRECDLSWVGGVLFVLLAFKKIM